MPECEIFIGQMVRDTRVNPATAIPHATHIIMTAYARVTCRVVSCITGRAICSTPLRPTRGRCGLNFILSETTPHSQRRVGPNYDRSRNTASTTRGICSATTRNRASRVSPNSKRRTSSASPTRPAANRLPNSVARSGRQQDKGRRDQRLPRRMRSNDVRGSR